MKKILAFALMFAILVGTFFADLKISFAQSVNPSPPDDNVSLFFQGGKSRILANGTINGQQTSIAFVQDSTLSFSPSPTSRDAGTISPINYYDSGMAHSIQLKNSGLDFNAYESITGYRLLAGSGGDALRYSLTNRAVTGGIKGDDANFQNQVGPFILVGKTSSGIYHSLGLHWYVDLNAWDALKQKILLLPRSDSRAVMQPVDALIWFVVRNETEWVNGYNMIKGIASVLNSSGSIGSKQVFDTMSGTNLESMCVNLSVSWNSLQQKVRDFFFPMPDAEHNSLNPNWSNDQNTWWERVKSGTSARNVILSIASTYLPEAYAQKAQAMLNDAGSDPFNITSTGAANAQEILSKSEEIKGLIDKIKSSSEPKLEGGTDEWKCGNIAKLTSFKWNKDIKGTEIKDLATLSSAVDKLVSDFNFFKESEDAGTGGICSSGSDTTTYSAIREAMCGLLILMHDWADNIFQTAVDWLNASLGVTNNSTIESPASTSPTSSSSTGSSSSSGSSSSTSGGSGSSTSGGSSSSSTPSSTSGTN